MSPSQSSDDEISSARLPLVILPIHYDIVYRNIDLVNHRFEGTVSLRCTGLQTIMHAAVAVKLHVLELQLLHATLQKTEASGSGNTSAPAGVVAAHEFHYHLRDQTCEIVFGPDVSLVKDQEYVLTVDFAGVLNNQMRGLYRSTYRALDGTMRTIATTQFEPTDARRAFPCLDEPALKATFSLTVHNVPSHMQCLSNTPVAATHSKYENGKATKTVVFQTTPKMSTYLLALVLGEFDCISQTSRQIVTTVYTVPGKAHQAEFCLDVAVKCLDYYQDIFGIAYPLTKSDLIGLPDFAAGAMENWGLVTYRESKVLVDSDSTSETMKRGIARTVCHELAHMWFGNLVTMEYWTQLYLKEGVARFMEFIGINHIFPEWQAWVEFVQSVYGLALSLDSMKSSHPVEVPVGHPDEINEIFDAISYAKGASIVRMISSFIGMDAFFKGMRIYLERHAYGNAVTKDLWQALEEASGVPVVRFMEPWTKQIGFPLIQLLDDGTIRVSRFFGSGPEKVPDGEVNRWPIPVTAIVEGIDGVQGPWVICGPDGDQSAELSAKIREWSLSNKWFKLNADQTGFFRVAYTKKQWDRLSTVMNPSTSPLATTDRLGLLSDLFATGRAGYSSIAESLGFVSSFGEHDSAEYAVWQEMSENLSALATLFRSESFFPKFQAFLKRLYMRQFQVLGWNKRPDETSRTGTMRATVIEMLRVSGDKNVLKEAFAKFIAYKKDPTGCPIDGNLQETVFSCALLHDEHTVFFALRDLFEVSIVPEERRNCLSVMASVHDTKLQQSIIDYVFWSGKVRPQDILDPLASLSGATDAGGLAIWKYFRENYHRLHDRLGSGPMWAPCVAMSCRGVTAPTDADNIEEFFLNPSHAPGSAKRRLAQALEVVRTRISRRERDREEMRLYFDDAAT